MRFLDLALGLFLDLTLVRLLDLALGLFLDLTLVSLLDLTLVCLDDLENSILLNETSRTSFGIYLKKLELYNFESREIRLFLTSE